MKSLIRPLTTCLCVGLLAACGAPTQEEQTAEPSALETQDFAADSDGFHSQGTLLQGNPFQGVFYGSAFVQYDGSRRPATLRLAKGEIIADMPLHLSGTTASLRSCSGGVGSGAERACGLVLEGQGLCKPGVEVTLSSGGTCRVTLPGSCTGRPVFRVCSDEQPCEHRGRGYLATGEPSFTPCTPFNACPATSFKCPASGVYTVLAGPNTVGDAWSLNLAASSGTYPATTKEVRGTALIGAELMSMVGGTAGPTLTVTSVTNASQVTIPESPGVWDASGATRLYGMTFVPAPTHPPVHLCGYNPDPNAGPGLAVPVHGLFDNLGSRVESTTAFTLGCDYGVIAKCYRWGYKPWLSSEATVAHWACTRMARADYCGRGTAHTLDGTPIRLWDALNPIINSPPSNPNPPGGVTFEAGWKVTGAACLSHWRWENLPANTCINLNPPIYDGNGNILNDCRTLPPTTGNQATCSQICDTAQEARSFYGATLFNESANNGAAGSGQFLP